MEQVVIRWSGGGTGGCDMTRMKPRNLKRLFDFLCSVQKLNDNTIELWDIHDASIVSLLAF
jgi:hypothetical protein